MCGKKQGKKDGQDCLVAKNIVKFSGLGRHFGIAILLVDTGFSFLDHFIAGKWTNRCFGHLVYNSCKLSFKTIFRCASIP